MKRVSSVLASLFFVSLLVMGGALAGTATEQVIQNASFDNGGTDWSAYWHDEVYGHAKWEVSYHNSEADIWVTSSVGGEYSGGGDSSYALIYQYVNLPQMNATNITSATLSIRYSAILKSPKDVSFTYGIISGGSWVVSKRVSFPHSSKDTIPWTILSQDITGFVKNNTGQRIKVEAEIYVGSWGFLLAYSHLYIDWIYLNITYKAENSGGSGGGSGGWWGGGGSGWSGGGSGWWGSGGSWHGGGGWFGIGGGWFGHTGAVNQTYVEYEVERMQELLAIGGGIIISILWVIVAMDYFSSNPDKRRLAKERAMTALLGTLIVAIAVLGAMWLLAGWMVGAW